ncbi:MAG: type II toxin-antitoxin system RelE/ParE family toxin [Bacteroidota bacterium]|nr:type II toxin-antitoxin system RelE/ParE family toxin [Bacteroidota bacterium]
MKYRIKIDKDALADIQSATDWYNYQVYGLGTRFQKQVVHQINSLKTRAGHYAIRYANVRCMLIKKFPFMVHYVIREEQATIIILAVFHTGQDPEIWKNRK